jgi:hypothetical protein
VGKKDIDGGRDHAGERADVKAELTNRAIVRTTRKDLVPFATTPSLYVLHLFSL